ncbi:hypothetical protein SELMODRAFT_441969 [Selaginella moellendorffii]|uniref:F-box domain-containing protein n=1 Tax=Selaginella moellendorffii TaxID=88036 RepID=D8RP99_SELML|nr:hypothetical protein SELMODRAFT_441969 [Selaginella moellendorffii]
MDILVHIIEQEVLKRLPAVALHCRIRAVCRQWRDLVDSPGFAKFYSTYHSKSKHLPPPRVLGITRNGEDIYNCNPFVVGSEAPKDWVHQDVYSHIRVFSTCGGLLLGMMGDDYVVLNPLTRALKVLPPPPLKAVSRAVVYILLRLHSALVLEPSMQRYWICIAEERLHVYDSRSGVWDQVDYLPGWSHLIYGVGMANSKAYFNSNQGILSFNMEEMRWSIEWSSSNRPMGAGWANWVVTTAPQFFIVAIGADRGVVKMMLIRLDCASKRFVKEASFPYNEDYHLIPPACFYEGTFMIPDKSKVFFLDYECIQMFISSLAHPFMINKFSIKQYKTLFKLTALKECGRNGRVDHDILSL